MSKKLNKHGIVKLWLVQLSVAGLQAVLFALFMNNNAAISALSGGLVCIIPNAYFASTLFRYEGARAAKKIVNSFYKGEAVKIILSVLLFTVAFKLFKVTPLAFFTSYILVLMTHWFAPWIIVNKQNRPKK